MGQQEYLASKQRRVLQTERHAAACAKFQPGIRCRIRTSWYVRNMDVGTIVISTSTTDPVGMVKVEFACGSHRMIRPEYLDEVTR